MSPIARPNLRLLCLWLPLLGACLIKDAATPPEPGGSDTGDTSPGDSDSEAPPADDSTATAPDDTAPPCGGAGTSTFYVDADGDGYGDPSAPVEACEPSAGVVADATDCDDTRADTSPGATDVPADGVDQDCSGEGVCDVLIPTEGDVTITTPEEAVALCASANQVLGSLTINYSTLTDVADLDCLCRVENTLSIQGNDHLVEIHGFPNLVHVGTYLWIDQNQALTSIDAFPYLDGLENQLSISYNDNLTEVRGFDRLSTVDGFYIKYNDALATLDAFASLEQVGERLYIHSTALTEITGFDALRSVGDLLYLGLNSALARIEGFNGLEEVGISSGNELGLQIESNGSLTSVEGFEALERAGKISFSRCPSLERIEGLGALSEIEGNLILEDLPKLSALPEWPLLVSLGELGMTQTGLPTLDGLDALERASGLDIWDNASLTNLDALDGLLLSGSDGGTVYVQLEDNALLEAVTGIDASGEVRISLANNALLTELSGFHSATAGSLSVEGNDSLETLDVLGGATELDDISIVSNPSLVSIPDFPAVALLTGTLTLDDNDALERVPGLNALTDIEDGATVSDNEALTEISGFNALDKVQHGLTLENNPSLTSLAGMSALRKVSGENFSITNNDALVDLTGLEGMRSVGKDLDISDNDALIDVLALSGVNTVGESLVIHDNTSLPTANAEALQSAIGDSNIGSGTSISGNAP